MVAFNFLEGCIFTDVNSCPVPVQVLQSLYCIQYSFCFYAVVVLYLSTRRSIYRIVHYVRETASLGSLLLLSTLDETTLTTVSTNFVLTLHTKIDT